MLKTVGNPSTRYGDQTVLDGNLIVGTAGKGVDFSSNSGAPGMTSELFDWYEEGTWTPTFEGTSGSAGAVAYAERAGSYTRIGNRVILNGTMILSNVGSWTGDVRIGGIPFNSTQASGSEARGAIELRNVTFPGNYVVTDLGRNDANKIALINVASGGAVSQVPVSGVANNGGFLFTITYRVA